MDFYYYKGYAEPNWAKGATYWVETRGHAGKPAISAYRFQDLSLRDHGDDFLDWREVSKMIATLCFNDSEHIPDTARAGELKAGWHRWQMTTPLGTSVCELARRELGMPTPHGDGWAQASESWHSGYDGLDIGPAGDGRKKSAFTEDA